MKRQTLNVKRNPESVVLLQTKLGENYVVSTILIDGVFETIVFNDGPGEYTCYLERDGLSVSPVAQHESAIAHIESKYC